MSGEGVTHSSRGSRGSRWASPRRIAISVRSRTPRPWRALYMELRPHPVSTAKALRPGFPAGRGEEGHGRRVRRGGPTGGGGGGGGDGWRPGARGGGGEPLPLSRLGGG